MEKIAFIGEYNSQLVDMILDKVNENGAEVKICCPSNNGDFESFGAVFYITKSSLNIDAKLLLDWVGHTHLRIVDADDEQRLQNEVLSFLGLPEPLEIERKFLIKMPDLKTLDENELCAAAEILQTYICTPDGVRARIRKRTFNGKAVYIKTIKRRISSASRIEIETKITEEEYNFLMKYADKTRNTIEKVRRYIVYGGKYFELDVYSFWNKQATLEIELLSEDEQFELPPFIEVIRDVTADEAYSNSALAKNVPKE